MWTEGEIEEVRRGILGTWVTSGCKTERERKTNS